IHTCIDIVYLLLFFSIILPHPPYTVFPYTTLFRSVIHGQYFGKNIMLRPRNHEQPLAVIDWETAALGPGTYDLVSVSCGGWTARSEEHTSELQSLRHLVCRLLLEKKKQKPTLVAHT